MGLATPPSAILSAVIFNALIIIIPPDPAGAEGRGLPPSCPSSGAAVLLRRNLPSTAWAACIVPVHRHQADRPDTDRPELGAG
jgi:high-affinity K+ transport system ATPase subunit B